jgi:hypothetical protein
MKTNLRMWAVSFGVLCPALMIAPNAKAQCLPAKIAGAAFHGNPRSILFLPVAVEQANENEHNRWRPTIVGFWHVIFTAKTMGGAPISDLAIDNALVVWHRDGTEIMNSGRPPQDGNFCMGVWQQTGEFTYKLNHFAWSANDYNPPTPPGIIGNPIGPVHYVESVTVGPAGKHYSGTFSLDQYDTTGQIHTSFTGVVSATRITVDTPASDLL